MASTSERLRSLVEGLLLATTEGRLNWEIASSSSYLTEVGGGRVEVAKDNADIRITVYGPNGNEVDSFDDNYLRNYSPQKVQFANYYAAMVALFESARRKATGADQVVDEILRALQTPLVRDNDDIPF